MVGTVGVHASIFMLQHLVGKKKRKMSVAMKQNRLGIYGFHSVPNGLKH